MTRPVHVMVTIDTEEDDWGTYRTWGNSTENIPLLSELVPLWERFGARPTYLVNYPPLASPESTDVLRALNGEGSCEMGVHCHPWNTPPLGEKTGQPTSMMNELSEGENQAKLGVLKDLFEELFHARPSAFRAGRWGFGPSVARPLHRLGFEVDLSVSPLLDWSSKGGPDYTFAPRQPYRFNPDHPFRSEAKGSMVGIPTSVGFLRGPSEPMTRVRAALEGSLLARLKVVGVLDALGLLARRWISPETSSGGEMIRLASTLTRSGFRVLDLTFHSPSLLPGVAPFVRSQADKERFVGRIERFLEFCAGRGYRFSTATEVAVEVRSGGIGLPVEA